MDTDSGINDKRLKLDSIADSSPGEQAHFIYAIVYKWYLI